MSGHCERVFFGDEAGSGESSRMKNLGHYGRGGCREEEYANLFLVLEAHLAYGHATVFLQIRPRSVDYCDVVLLVSCTLLGLMGDMLI